MFNKLYYLYFFLSLFFIYFTFFLIINFNVCFLYLVIIWDLLTTFIT